MINMFLSNNPSSGDINSSNLSCFIWPYITLLTTVIVHFSDQNATVVNVFFFF